MTPNPSSWLPWQTLDLSFIDCVEKAVEFLQSVGVDVRNDDDDVDVVVVVVVVVLDTITTTSRERASVSNLVSNVEV